MLGYACYTERFADTLSGIPSRLPYLRDLGVTYLHLMLLQAQRRGKKTTTAATPRGTTGTVRADLGDVDDLRELTRTLRGDTARIRSCLDLVLNHVAREHEWARRARAGEPRYRDLLPRLRRSPRCRTPTRARCPRSSPSFAPGNFTWDARPPTPGSGRRSNEWQWDLNWANPDVLVEPSPTSCSTLANLGRRGGCASTPIALHPGSGSAPTARTSPRCTRSPQALRTVARIALPPALALQGRGHRRPARTSCSTSGPGAPCRPAERPRLPQQPHGAGCGQCSRRGSTAARQAGAPGPPDDSAERTLYPPHPLPRRHRVGDRRRRCGCGRAERLGAPPLPVRLVRR